jgi:endonuclease III
MQNYSSRYMHRMQIAKLFEASRIPNNLASAKSENCEDSVNEVKLIENKPRYIKYGSFN